MITRITKDNRAQYFRLFAQANAALGFAEDNEEYITSLEEYFLHIEELFEANTSFIRLPLDEEPFEIDLNTRQINIPASFKKSGLAVQGDHVAETVYFRCDRFFDTSDLFDTFIAIQWEAPNGKKMISPACFKDVDSEPGKLIFGWAITETMTSMSGNLKFSVIFIDGHSVEETDNNDKELFIQELNYRLGTLTSSINISAGLNLLAQEKVGYEDARDALTKRIKNSSYDNAVEEDKEGRFMPELVAYRQFDWSKGVHVYENIHTDLLDNNTTLETETGLAVLAVSPGAGRITYQWFKEGIDSPLSEGVGACRYFKVDYADTDEKKVDAPIYYIKDVGNETYRAFDENKDSWMLYDAETDTEYVNDRLYERVAFLPLPIDADVAVPGKYYVVIKNKQGKKYNELNTKTIDGYAVIPGPTEIEKITVTANKEIFNEADPDVILSATGENVQFVSAETIYQKLKYAWHKIVDGELSDVLGTEETYAPESTGDYVVVIENHWNKAKTDPKRSENIIKIYVQAIKPVITEFTANNIIGREEEGEKLRLVSLKKENPDTVLTVAFDEIVQDQAVQYVRWEYSDSETVGEEFAADFVEIIDPETGKPVEGTTYMPTEPGDYRPVVYNFITENNQEQTTVEVKDIIRVVTVG